MSWSLLTGLVIALGLLLAASFLRRSGRRRMFAAVRERDRTRKSGAEAQLQFPVIDLTRCMGCGACVAGCPEGVLELVHGQSAVINPSACVGIAECERNCPVDAITITIANLESRRDIPALTPELEAVGTEGLFLAGEVTAHGLIKTAIDHGVAVGATVAERVRTQPPPVNGQAAALDLCIVGAGPAGLACSLEAKRQGLRFETLDREEWIGGTVAKYPRRKLVLTQPVELPVYGRLTRTSYTKEELMGLWNRIATEQELPIRGGEVYQGLESDGHGGFVVHTEERRIAARNVVLALGRRGLPRQLGIPGEELPKVAHSLMDASAYGGRRILVVGGGDSAVEAAVGLARQPGSRVSLSYRRGAFTRVKKKSRERLDELVRTGAVQLLLESDVLAIRPAAVELVLRGSGGAEHHTLPNDDVFVMAGGVAPLELLERSGVSFDPAHREPVEEVVERGSGAYRALCVCFGLAFLALLFALWHVDYYALPSDERPTHPKHTWLRPGKGLGLQLGFAATGLILFNLAYLLRRSGRLRCGPLRAWMSLHVGTGLLAFLCALLHAAMAPKDSMGGHAFWSLAVLVGTGAVGRYFYSYVPRAANGRELELDEVRAQLAERAAGLAGGAQEFADRAQRELEELVHRRQWKGNFATRLLALLGLRLDLRLTTRRIEREALAAGVPAEEVARLLDLARRAHRKALTVAHYEDLRALLGTWRWLHRWVTALMVLLLVLHVWNALFYGSFFEPTGSGGGGR